jgi:serine protease Do
VRIKAFRMLLIFLTGLARLSSVQLDEYQVLAYKIKPAVIRVVAVVVVEYTYIDQNNASRNGSMALGGTGSGFIFNREGYIVTNGQVIDRVYGYENNADAFINDVSPYVIHQVMRKEGFNQITPDIRRDWAQNRHFAVVNSRTFKKVILSNGETIDFEIRRFSPSMERGGKDVGLLKIERNNLPVVNLGDSSEVELQEEVQVFGFPGAADIDGVMGFYLNPKSLLQVMINVGRISSKKQDYRGVPLIQTNVVVGPGSSGGPAIDKNGEVIGVTTHAGGEVDEFRQVQGVNFLIPVNTVKEFIRDIGVEINKGSMFNDIYFKALGHVWNEDWYEGGREVDSLLDLFNDSPDLKELKQKIAIGIEHMPWWRKLWKENRVAFVIGIFIVVLVILFFFLIFGSRRKPGTSAEKEAKGDEKPMPAAIDTQVAPKTEERTMRLLGNIEIFIDDQKMGRYPVTEDSLTIGRDPAKAGIVIPDPIVSKLHCSIFIRDNSVVIKDHESTNGTYFQDQKVAEKILNENDVILLGKRGSIKIVFHNQVRP